MRSREWFPAVELFLHEMKADGSEKRLANNWLDVSFLYLPFDDERFRCMTVDWGTWSPFLTSIRRSLRERSMEDLAEEPFILPARHRRMPGLYGRVMEPYRQAGFVPEAVQKNVWLMQTIVGLVDSGLGIALVPDSPCKVYSEGVEYMPIADQGTTVETGEIWRHEDATPALGSFLETVRRVSAQRVDQPL